MRYVSYGLKNEKKMGAVLRGPLRFIDRFLDEGETLELGYIM